MAEINRLYEFLLPETQQRLTQDWAEARYSGQGTSGRLNRYGLGSVGAPGGATDKQSPNEAGRMALEGATTGTTVGAIAGGPVGAAIGAAVGGAVLGGIGALDSRKYNKFTPNATGRAWEERLAANAPGFADDPYKTTLAMLFMSDSRKTDPYRFSSDTATKRKGWNRRKVGRARYWLAEGNRPGKMQEGFVRNAKGFLDWRGYAGSGGDRYARWAPTWVENMLSRSLYKEHRDLWDAEKARTGTWQRQALNLANKGDNYSTGTQGTTGIDNLGGKV